MLQRLAAGNKIEAIKFYREATHSSLVDAKNTVEAMAAGRTVAMPAPSPAAVALSTGDVENLIRAGRKIDAIKAFREKTGLGLAEAKAAVEMMQAQIERGAPVSEPRDPPPVVAPGPALSSFGGGAASTYGSTAPAPTRKSFSSDDLERTSPTPSGFGFFVVFAVILAAGGALAYLMSGG